MPTIIRASMDAIEREVAKVVRTGCARLPLSCTRSIEEPISGTGSPPVWSILSVVGETAVDRRYNHRGISPPSIDPSNGISDSRFHARVFTRFASHYSLSIRSIGETLTIASLQSRQSFSSL